MRRNFGRSSATSRSLESSGELRSAFISVTLAKIVRHPDQPIRPHVQPLEVVGDDVDITLDRVLDEKYRYSIPVIVIDSHLELAAPIHERELRWRHEKRIPPAHKGPSEVSDLPVLQLCDLAYDDRRSEDPLTELAG